MDDSYDKNGYGGSDFKRNIQQDDKSGDHIEQDGDEMEGGKLNEKAGEYMREVLSEKVKIDQAKFPISTKLLDQEVTRVQTTGRLPARDSKYVDVYREKPIKVVAKILVPVKEFPKFNFVGKLLGPKGNTMKQLQEETMCKMAVLGRGSMRDRKKEEELRVSLDPKYAHLSDELHVEVSALAPPAEAHARMAYALAEVRKYLLPDTVDVVRHTQMREIMERGLPDMGGRNGPRSSLLPTPKPIAYTYASPVVDNRPHAAVMHTGRPPARMSGAIGGNRMPGAGGGNRMQGAVGGNRMQGGGRGPQPGKNKVMSILDRARTAIEDTYSYDDPYGVPEPMVRGAVRTTAPEVDYYSYDRPQERYYEDDYYKEEAPRPEYKRRPTASAGGAGGAGGRQYRQSPYARPQK